MLKRLTISLALLFAAMVLVFGDWAVSDEAVPTWPGARSGRPPLTNTPATVCPAIDEPTSARTLPPGPSRRARRSCCISPLHPTAPLGGATHAE